MMACSASALLTLLATALPPLITTGELEPQGQVREESARAWQKYEAIFLEITLVPPRAMYGSITVRKGELPRGHSGQSRPGEIRLKQAKAFSLSDRELEALRHELAHQFLFAACPQASSDRLFHEAFALSMSGELGAWADDEYSGLSWALGELTSPGVGLNSKSARRALARLLVEGLQPEAALPRSLVAPLKRCADQTSWVLLEPRVLAAPPPEARVDATVVIHRASGEVVFREGRVEEAVPYGSTLKPFVVAGAVGTPPNLPRRNDVEWSCGDNLPPTLGAAKALSRSCNGYFLDWASKAPEVARLGAWGAVLLAAGLERLPTDMPEAMGLRSTLSLSPLGLARAYRLLAAARPDLLDLLREGPRDGTLSGLSVSKALDGLATKTGTVRDAQSRPRHGWIVGVSDTLVVVMVKNGRMPRSFAEEFGETVERASRSGGEGAGKVQVFGLLEPSDVEASCTGPGFALVGIGRDTAPELLPERKFGLQREGAKGRLMCLTGPFRVQFPGIQPPGGRDYAGVFAVSPPPLYRAPPGSQVSEGARRARQGSTFVFETSRSLYAAGVVEAEDALIQGEARAALMAVVDANGQHPRHGGRPVCDTTHCQVFLGTVKPRPADRAALAHPLETSDWLLFSRGGAEWWREERPLRQVEAVLGGPFSSLELQNGQSMTRRTEAQGEALWDNTERFGCEALRGPLKLPSCPKAARRNGASVVFEGQGRGHGLGLDVEWAKSSGLKAEELLFRAYGDTVRRL